MTFTSRLFTLLFISYSALSARINFDPRIDMFKELILNQEYLKVRYYFENIIKTEPHNIDALYMRLFTYQAKIIDYESYAVDTHIYLQKADSLLSKLSDKLSVASKNDSTKIIFYMGSIHGVNGLVQAKVGDWVSGIKNAHISFKELSTVRQRDTTAFQANYGIGLYNYYVGNTLRWVPFMGSRASNGINEIIDAAQGCGLFSYGAKNNLLWIYYERGEYTLAESFVDQILEGYPDNTIFLRVKIRIVLMLERYDDALFWAKRLAVLSKQRTPVNWSDLLSAYQVMVEVYHKKGDSKRCRELAKEAFAFIIPDNARKISYVKQHLDYIGTINMKHSTKEK